MGEDGWMKEVQCYWTMMMDACWMAIAPLIVVLLDGC